MPHDEKQWTKDSSAKVMERKSTILDQIAKVSLTTDESRWLAKQLIESASPKETELRIEWPNINWKPKYPYDNS